MVSDSVEWHSRTLSSLHLRCALLLVCALVLAAGCKSMAPGHIERVQAVSDAPRAGNVYLLRGFIGIWSYGIDHLGRRIEEAGIRASVYQEDQWQALCEAIIRQYKAAPDAEPLVLIGHSYGADDTLRIAKRLEEQGMKVDLVITLDPVTPPAVPGNIRLCYNIYQSNALDSLPFFRGIPLEAEMAKANNLVNVNIRTDRRDLLEPGTDHFNIEKNAKVHEEVVRKVMESCPPRQTWLAQRDSRRYPAAAMREPNGRSTGGAGPSRAAGTAPPDLDRVP